jgi:hypothetical protein
VTYRVVPHATARAQLGNFPPEAFNALIEALTDVADDPYDPLRTLPTKHPQERRAVFGEEGLGLVTFWIDDTLRLVTVFNVTWAG